MGLTLVEGKGKKREWAEGETGCNTLSTKALADPARTSLKTRWLFRVVLSCT